MAAGTAGQRSATRQSRRAARVQLASDPAASWFTLWRLAIRDWPRRPMARALAANPRSPRLLLRCLGSRRWDVLALVAANPRCPPSMLRSMVWAPDWAIRAAVAANPAATLPILESLITGSGPRVRLYAAGNPSLSEPLAGRLLADPDQFVRAVAARHPAASAAALGQLAEGMAEPAWVLQAIAGNPACPPELTDQLLTWIALGGSGHSDPLFDPVECTGNPGDTRFEPFAWYQEQARRPGAERHPLWAVRASVLNAQHRISLVQARSLARDPRPEVRRSLATGQLPLDVRRQLRRDADPQVAGLAAAVGTRNKQAERKRQARRLIPVWLGLGMPLAIALLVLSSHEGQIFGSTSGTSSSGNPARTAGSGQRAAGSGQPGGNSAASSMLLAPSALTMTVPGGGVIICEPLHPRSARAAVVDVVAGDEVLTLRVHAGELTRAGRRSVVRLAIVRDGRQATFRVRPVDARLSVAAGAATAATPADTFRCGS